MLPVGSDAPGPSGYSGPSAMSLQTIQQAKLLFAISNGPIAGPVHPCIGSGINYSGLRDIFLNDVPIEINGDHAVTIVQDYSTGVEIDTPVPNGMNFNGISVAITSGTLGQTPIPGFTDTETLTSDGAQITTTAPQVISIPNDGPTAVRLNIALPGLFNQDTSNGNMNSDTVVLQILVSNNGGDFKDRSAGVGIQNCTITGLSTGPAVRGLYLRLTPYGSGPWAVKIVRTTPDNSLATRVNTTYLQSYSIITEQQLIYPGTALLGISIDAAHFANIPKVSIMCRGRIIQVPANYTAASRNPDTGVWTPAVYATTGTGTTAGAWDGTFKALWSSNPAWVFYDMATSSVYGAGKYLAASGVNKWQLYTIAQYCDGMVSDGLGGTEPRFSFNGYLQSPDEAFKVLAHIISSARAMLYYGGGQAVPVQDVDGTPVALFTPSNVMNGIFNYQGTARKARHTVASVYWNDPSQLWASVPEYVQADDVSIARYGIQTTNLTAVGSTSLGQTRRFGRWAILSEINELECVSFTTGMDGIVARPGDLILVQDPARLRARMGGRVVSATSNTITLDGAVTLLAGQAYTLWAQLPDGSITSQAVTTGAGTTATLTISGTFSTVPMAQAQWLLSSSSQAATRWRIVSIKEDHTSTQKSYQIVALANCEAKYALADSTDSLVPRPVSTNAYPAPTGVAISSTTVKQADRLAYTLSASWIAPAGATPASYNAIYRLNGGPWQSMTVSGCSSVANDIPVGTYDVWVSAVYNGGPSAYAPASGFVLGNAGGSPAENAQTTANTANTTANTANTTANTANTTANTANTVIAQQNSASYMTNSDKIGFVAQWVAESNTQTALDAQAVTAGVSHTAYDNAVSNVSTGLITAGAPSNWASIWPDGTTSGPWTNVMLTINSLWAAVASQRAALVNAIASAGAAAAQAAAIASAATDATTKMNSAILLVPANVTSLPGLPSASYPAGKLVMLTTNSQLYQVNTAGTAWVSPTVAAANISGTLSAAQVASLAASQITGTLTAAQIASVNASAVGAGLTASQISSVAATALTGTLVDAQIAGINGSKVTGTLAASVPTSQLSGQVQASQIQANSIGANQIAAGAITAAQIAAGTITGTQIAGQTITGANIVGQTITASQIAANAITAAQIAAGAITAAQIAAGTIQASNIAAGTITAANLAANSVTATQLAAGAVTATSIAAGSIGAAQIAANAIGVQNLTVSNFDNLCANPTCAIQNPLAGSYESVGLVSGLGAADSSLQNNGYTRLLYSHGDGGSYPLILGYCSASPGDQFYVQCLIGYMQAQNGNCCLELGFINASGGYISGVTGAYVSKSWWTQPGSLCSCSSAVAPAGTTQVRLVLWFNGCTVPNNIIANNFYWRRCADAKVIVDGSITTTKLVANAVMTSNFATDTGQTASSLGNTGIPVGNPTAGAWLGVGSANPILVGPGGLKMGIPQYGGSYVSYKVDAPAVMSYNALRTNYTTSSPPQYPRFWYGGNCDTGTLGGAPNISRLTLNVTVWDTSNHIAWMDFVLVPSAATDNLDSMRYANIQFYRQSAAGTSGTLTAVGPVFKVTLPDRAYQDPNSDGDGVNAVATTASAVHSGFSGGFLACIVTLYNSFGASAANCFYTPAGWSPGASLINNNTSFPSGLSGGGSGGGGGGGGGIGCVPAGTPLLLADGTWLSIDEATIGMEVAAWDDQTLQPVPARIARTFVFEDRALWRIVTADGELVCSHDHRILQGAAWVPAREAVVGVPTLWRLATGKLVYSTILEAAPTGETATVYHVGLDHGHVYCAGDLLAHNMKAPS